MADRLSARKARKATRAVSMWLLMLACTSLRFVQALLDSVLELVVGHCRLQHAHGAHAQALSG